MPERWFQQDNATAHTADQMICRFSNIPYSERSLDLTALNVLLWGYLNQRVYTKKSGTYDHMKVNIGQETCHSNICHGKRANMCQARSGRH